MMDLDCPKFLAFKSDVFILRISSEVACVKVIHLVCVQFIEDKI